MTATPYHDLAARIEAADGPPMRDEPVACFACEGKPAPDNTPCAICGATRPADDMVRQLVEALKAANAAIENDTGLDDAICCSGYECGCRGSSHRQLLLYDIGSILTTARAQGYGG